jgi:NAD(P)H-dependent flavin oxidoreductase YrpB (nitropropane dioxygenase family)
MLRTRVCDVLGIEVPVVQAAIVPATAPELVAAVSEAGGLGSLGKQEADKAERDLQRMSRERLLPDEKTLEKVARYEAHLSRQLYKALHELEALQTRRQGGSAPLARLDVDRLTEG